MTESAKTFYISTPIYYPSGKLHIGNAYTSLLCDAIARYKRMMGYNVFFVTGTDEHGQKIEKKAEDLGMTPKQYVDDMANSVKALWELLDIRYDYFIRTTDDYHEKVVQDVFERLLEQGDIYLGEYSGWYSVNDEEFFTESQFKEVFKDEQGNVIGGIAPSGHQVERVTEESYFFRMSRYADRLLAYYEEHSEFITPDFRKTEMINNFIKPGLEDLAVSRTTFSWGIPVKSNPKHVVYVWIDALMNYITALGYGSDDQSRFERYWPGDVHVLGKDISRFHMIYWPTLLMALNIPLPKQLFAHGWLLMKDGKMSKSKGNVLYPETLVERYGRDVTRYYLLRDMTKGNDSVFTPEDFVLRVNSELANDLGNLLNRTVAMVNKYLSGEIVVNSADMAVTPYDEALEQFVAEHIAMYHDAMAQYSLSDALTAVMTIVSRTNKYIDETMPWQLAKTPEDLPQLRSVMYHLAEALRIVAHLLNPVMPSQMLALLEQLGLSEMSELNTLTWGQFPAGCRVVAKGAPLFPRLDTEEEVTYLQNIMAPKTDTVDLSVPFNPEETELKFEEVEHVDFDQFIQTELKVAEVIDVEPVEGSNKLLKFRLDAGDKGHRQILSGIAKFYPDYKELVGRKLCIVANLKPRKMMGHISQGMILSAEKDEALSLVFAPDDVPNGALIG